MYTVLCVSGEPLVVCTPTRAVFTDDDMSEVLTSIESSMFNDICTQYSFNLDGKRVMNVTPHIVNVASAYIALRCNRIELLEVISFVKKKIIIMSFLYVTKNKLFQRRYFFV